MWAAFPKKDGRYPANKIVVSHPFPTDQVASILILQDIFPSNLSGWSFEF